MRSRAMTPGALRWKNATRNSAAGIDHMSQAVPARMAHDGTLRAGRPRLQSPDAWTTMCAAMEFGFSLPGRGPLAGAETILKLATRAESLRFSSLFVTDHVVLPASMARSTYPYSTTGQLPGGAAQDYLEPLVTMGWLARVTSRIRLGTSVLGVPYRNPVLVAKMLATIDRLSGGRVILGAGVGWVREEFEALAAPPLEARDGATRVGPAGRARSEVRHPHRARADGGAPQERQAARRRAAALPGNGGAGHRRHPRLSGGRRHPLRLRPDGARPQGRAHEHGPLRPRRARQGHEGAARVISHDEAVRLMEGPPAGLDDLLARAAQARDTRGRVVTFSAKVFVPLTTLCRDDCGYCTFRRDPGQPGAHTMTPDEVIALCQAGGRLGAKEALFSLGDRPEARFPEHREFLKARGHRTTLSYLKAVCAATLAESGLLPHVNPGLMAERDLAALREVSVSMGLMLETTSERLLAPGGAHHRAPDKVPRRRLKTIELAGKLSIPFTTGILIGIGETPRERADALVAIRDLHERYGHVQEVIVQNFRAKPLIPMRHHPEPSLGDSLRAIAVGRLLLGPDVTIQAPPNLSPRVYPRLLAAGLNDWGGISPLTPDHINPEKPWPGLAELRRASEAAGFVFRERLAVYPAFATRPEFVDETLRARVAALIDGHGLVREPHEHWRRW